MKKDYNIKVSDVFIVRPEERSKEDKELSDMLNKEWNKYLQYCKDNNLEPKEPVVSAVHTDAKVYWEIQDAMRKYNDEN